MLENILVGVFVLIIFGAAGFVWGLENGRLERKEKEDQEKTEKAEEN